MAWRLQRGWGSRLVQRAARCAAASALHLVLLGACGTAPEAPSLRPVLEDGALLAGAEAVVLERQSMEPGSGSGAWVPRPVLPRAGWGRADHGWRPVGGRSTLDLLPPADPAADLYLRFRDRRAGATAPIRLRVALDGRPLGGLELAGGPTSVRFPVATGDDAAPLRLELVFDPPLSGEGRQEIGLTTVGWLTAEPPRQRRRPRVEEGAVDPAPGSSSRRTAGSALRALPDGGLGGLADGTLHIPPGGHFASWLQVPEKAGFLELEVRFPEAPAAGGALAVVAVDLGAGDRELARAESGREPGAWRRLRCDLSPVAGRDVLLVFGPEATGGPVEIREPVWRGLTPVPATETGPPPPPPPAAGAARPDVLLIILDAARGDRFDGSYARRTHPRIDELFTDGMLFRKAFSECPSTVCSIPNLITGIGFLRGGDTFQAHRVAPRLTTLAESLQGAGYRTVGLSANPNNSRSRGCDQGFDEFRELWGANPHHGPFGMSELAVDAITRQPDDQPLYLQLHYLPPHQPYEPQARHDVFRDREYRGPVHPRMSLRPYFFGQNLMAGADLEQLVDLYDGNLLTVDEAVGLVFDASRRAGRWNDTLVVLTSDHGEAFMEHGRLGHNTTLYDEMLHVPLLVRLPGGEQPPHDPDRLAAVADVVPTILGRLGLRAGGGLAGIDLLAQQPDPRRPRLVMTRTSHPEQSWLAARSDRWKAIVWPNHQEQMLFDLEADPGETRNLLLERPLVFAALGLRLRDHLAATAGEVVGEAVDIPESEKRELRALGYVE